MQITAARLSELYSSLELPLEQVLARMELRGVALDINKLKDLHTDLSERLVLLEKQAFELAGMEFNMGSPKQVSQILI